MVPPCLQAQASGRPVIAFGAGGALDTIVEGQTGIFFREPKVEALIAAIHSLDPDDIDPRACVENAARFDVSIFRQELTRLVECELEQRPQS